MKLLRLAICQLFILCLCVPMLACQKIEKLDWTMNAYWLSVDGQVQKSFYLTVSGPIVYNDDDTTLEFMIHFPSESKIEYRLPKTGKYTNMATLFENTDYYIWYPALLNTASGNSIDAIFALSVDQQFLIIYQEDAADPYVVASTDPNTAPSEILAYFREFIDFCAKG